jgi:hypothetical protein
VTGTRETNAKDVAMVRDRDELVDLAERLVERGEFDAAEILASEAGYADHLLWAAADWVRPHRYANEDKIERLRPVVEVLESAAVESLRHRRRRAPSEDLAPDLADLRYDRDRRPHLPHVTVDFTHVVDVAKKKDVPLENLLEHIVKTVLMVMDIAGEREAAKDLVREARREFNDFRPDPDQPFHDLVFRLLDLISKYVNLVNA